MARPQNQITPRCETLIIYDNIEPIPTWVRTICAQLMLCNIPTRHVMVESSGTKWQQEAEATAKSNSTLVYVLSMETNTFHSHVKKTMDSHLKKKIIIHQIRKDSYFLTKVKHKEDIILVNEFENISTWWPYILLVVQSDYLKNGNKRIQYQKRKKEFDCFYIIDEQSETQMNWYSSQRKTLEQLRVACVCKDTSFNRERVERFISNSACCVVYVVPNATTEETEELKWIIQTARDSGTLLQAFVEVTSTSFNNLGLPWVDKCDLVLYGDGKLALWAAVMEAMDKVHITRSKDTTYYSGTPDQNMATTFRRCGDNNQQRPPTTAHTGFVSARNVTMSSVDESNIIIYHMCYRPAKEQDEQKDQKVKTKNCLLAGLLAAMLNIGCRQSNDD